MRVIVRFEKGKELKYLSHLDLQRLFQRALRRADVPVAYSQGFNPHPQLSFATALGVGQTSAAEWMEVRLAERMPEEEFLRRINAALPKGLVFLEASEAPEGLPSLASLLRSALYRLELRFEAPMGADELAKGVEELLAGPIMAVKHAKGENKRVDLRPMVLSIAVLGEGRFLVKGVLTAAGSLNAALLANELLERMGGAEVLSIHREAIYGGEGAPLPKDPDA